MADPNLDEGQAVEDSTGATETAPETMSGQSAASEQTTQQGSVSTADDSFFDPSSIQDSPELMKAYKQMQAAYTKKTQSVKSAQQKIEAYDNFQRDPMGYIKQLASQYGLTIAEGQESGEWQPNSWDELLEKAEERAISKLAPQMQQLRKSQLERTLDDSFPDWRMYEDKMSENLQEHPTLAKNPELLYRLSVPPEVIESRATQQALKKLQNKAKSAEVSGGSTTTRTASAEPDKPLSFQEAVKFAQNNLAQQGLRPN